MNRKKKLIYDMRNRKFGCSVSNLPIGVLCAYRAHYFSEIVKHERSHSIDLETERKSNASLYEVNINEYQQIIQPDQNVNRNVDQSDQIVDQNLYQSVDQPNQNVTEDMTAVQTKT